MKEHEKRILEAVSKLSGVPTSEIINPPGCMKRSTARIFRCRQLCVRLNAVMFKTPAIHAGTFIGLYKTTSRLAVVKAQHREGIDKKFRANLVTLYHMLREKSKKRVNTRMKKDYVIVVGNIGNIPCNNRREAGRVYQEYVAISKSGKGRGGDEPVALFVDGELVREFDPWAVRCRKGSFREAVWKILGPFAGDEPMLVDLISYEVIKNGKYWETNDMHFMCTGLEAHQALDAICERYKTWKATHCPGARVRDLVDTNEDGDNPILAVREIPFMEIRIS